MAGPTREWVTFEDPKEEGRTWQIDVTFLLSSWECIFGCGCQGVLTGPAPELVQGCCSYGAHFSDRKDRDHVVRMAKLLTADEWQFMEAGQKKGIYAKSGKDEDGKQEWRTRLVDDACIFLNRPGFPAGAGMRTARPRHASRQAPQRSQARGLLAAPASSARRRARRRDRHLHPQRVRTRWLGRGRRGLRVVVHRGTRGIRRERSGLREPSRRAAQDAGQQAVRARSAPTSTHAGPQRSRPVVHPAENKGLHRQASRPRVKQDKPGSDQASDIPPSMTSTEPVNQDEASETRNSAADAMSSGRPMRPSGCALAMPASFGSHNAPSPS